jgi:large subunit ribosomal protein L16
MGKGKGGVEGWVARIKQGRVLFEMDGCTSAEAEEALRLASNKLGIKTRFLDKTKRVALV